MTERVLNEAESEVDEEIHAAVAAVAAALEARVRSRKRVPEESDVVDVCSSEVVSASHVEDSAEWEGHLATPCHQRVRAARPHCCAECRRPWSSEETALVSWPWEQRPWTCAPCVLSAVRDNATSPYGEDTAGTVARALLCGVQLTHCASL